MVPSISVCESCRAGLLMLDMDIFPELGCGDLYPRSFKMELIWIAVSIHLRLSALSGVCYSYINFSIAMGKCMKHHAAG
jgi:hypothetical protein